MRTKSRVAWLVVSLTIILFLSSGTQVLIPDKQVEQPTVTRPSLPERGGTRVSGTPHAPIVIDGDANFTATAQAEGWPGNGTSENPFIIENLDIDLGGAPGDCITILNTLVHFIIRDCNLTGASIDPGSGIYLFNIVNGKLINNTCNGNDNGIYLDYSRSSTLSNNTCSSNNIGIFLNSNSNNNELVNNTCISNSNIGILLIWANSNTLVNNNCTSNLSIGIYIYLSDSNTLSDNTFISNNDYGIWLDDTCDLNDIQWNVFVDNPTNSIDEGTDNVFDYNYWSDYVGTDSNEDGFGDVPYTFTANSDPHPLVHVPTPSTWTQSPVDQVVEFGFLIICDLNVTAYIPIIWDLNNSLFRIDDEGMVTSWFPLPIGIYGIEVVVTDIRGHNITGSFRVSVQDTTAPHWMIEPSNQVLQHGEGIDYQLPVEDFSGLDHWTLNDTSQFTLTAAFYHSGSTARIVNATPLDPGVHGLNVTVFDQHGNSLSAIFSVIVEADTTAPTWVIFPIDYTVEYLKPVTIQLAAWDESGIHLWWLNDTVHFTIDEYGVIRNATLLGASTYYLEIRAYDFHDNYLIATLTVTVFEVTTVTTATTGPTSTVPAVIDPVMTLALGAGLGGAAVIVIVIAILRKR